ncbi:MAG: heavy-metal-associated domain-containing protein [Bacteroidetes bacterium]|nr:heavy-metal-associated domain-containing protein [Bacteroidota bacterium]
MKRLIIFSGIIFSSLGGFAQSNDIATIKDTVDGSCDMCKKRIEEAAFVKGVKRVEWNVDSHVLTVIYRPSKTNENTILQSVAKAGHSSEKIKATDADYNKLPECCHYKTNSCSH